MLTIAAARSPLIIAKAVWPYILLIGFFGAFVVWNGGVVLGDKSNHIATIHLPQMLYIWPYIFFFSAPLLYPNLIGLLSLGMPYPLRRMFQRRSRDVRASHISFDRFKLIAFLGIFSLLASVVVHFNTIIHPFTLADNRHYVFYVFRILRRPYFKYLAIPIYGICAWISCRALAGEGYRVSGSTGDGETKKASEVRYEGCDISFVVIWLVTSALTLCSTSLVEPRYFILPWIMWRLHVPQRFPRRDTMLSEKELRSSNERSAGGALSLSNIEKFYSGYDHRLWMETLWFLIVNAATGYMFLHRGFEWPQEPENVQRFMW